MLREDPDCSTENPMFNEIAQDGIGQFIAPGAPWAFSGFERAPAAPAPNLGQHTDEVLLDVVGLSSSELGKLHDQGIVASAE